MTEKLNAQALKAADDARARLKSVLADLSAGQHEAERVRAALADMLEQKASQDAVLSRAQRHIEDLNAAAASVTSATQLALQRQHEQASLFPIITGS